MSRPRFISSVVVALIAVSALLPGSALAAPPEIEHFRFSDVFEDVEVCGIEVDIAERGVFTGRAFFDDEGNFVRFLGTVSGETTFTAENGESVVNRFVQQFVDTEVVDEEAGTITFFTTVKGLPEQIKTPHGGLITLDAGIITFATTFDLETGEEISSEIVEIKGPHPEAEEDFELFCEVFTEALS
jgi:hypothetical protein